MPSLRRKLPLALLCAVILAALIEIVQTTCAQTPLDPDAPAPVAADWVTWVDPDYHFALLLPPSHRIARSGTRWYVHGTMNGEPLVPDVTIAFLPERSVAEVLKEGQSTILASETVEMGPGTLGVRVISTYETPDGEPYNEDFYLIEAPEGIFRISRYESFDWPPFTSVARSFRLVRQVGDSLR